MKINNFHKFADFISATDPIYKSLVKPNLPELEYGRVPGAVKPKSQSFTKAMGYQFGDNPLFDYGASGLIGAGIGGLLGNRTGAILGGLGGIALPSIYKYVKNNPDALEKFTNLFSDKAQA